MTLIQSLVLAIVQHNDAESAIHALSADGFQVTCISTIGGFLRTGNVTLLIGLPRNDVPRALELLSEHCRKRTSFINAEPFVPAGGIASLVAPVEVEIGGAAVFVLPVEQFVHIDAQRKVLTFEPGEKKGEPMRTKVNMKLVMAIVPEEFAERILDSLTQADYGATLVSTTGGFLRKGNATLLIGVEATQVEQAIQRIEQACLDRLSRINTPDSSVNVFVLNVEQFESIGLEPTPVSSIEINPLMSSA